MVSHWSRQSGFRKNHSTETALIRIIDELLFSLDKNRVSGMVLVDYYKAFDMVDHALLLQKLNAYGLHNISLEWFRSYLTNRRQLVSLAGKESDMATIVHGVPQGSILGPLLFINDLPLHVSTSQVDLYADDTTLTASVDIKSMPILEESLNSSVSDVVAWASENKLPLNESKTKVLLVTGKRLSSRIEQTPTVMVQETHLNNVASVTLLGLEIDAELTFEAYLINCVKRCHHASLLKKIRYLLPLKQRLLYYNATIRPAMNYVSVIWTTCNQESLGRVLKLQKRAAMVILFAERQSPSVQLFNKATLDTFLWRS